MTHDTSRGHDLSPPHCRDILQPLAPVILALPHWRLTHRIARVFTQLLLFRGRVHHEFLKARRAEGRALLLVHDELRHGEFGAPVRRQLRFAPRGSAGCAERMLQRLPAGAAARNRGALIGPSSSFKGRRGRAAQIGLRRRDHAVQMFLFTLKHPQSRLLFAGLRAPGGASALQSQFRTEQGLGFLLEILPHPPLVGQRLLPLGAALMLGGFLLHRARAAAAGAGQPERTPNERGRMSHLGCPSSGCGGGGVGVGGGDGGGGGTSTELSLQ